jgi:hypothetical protein
MTTTTYTDEVACVPRAGTLYDVLELILDRGMVIDVFVRVSLVGIEILKIDARIVVASVDTYLRFAEACNRLDLENNSRSRTAPDLFGRGEDEREGITRSAGRRPEKNGRESLENSGRQAVGRGDDASEGQKETRPRRRTSPRRHAAQQ